MITDEQIVAACAGDAVARKLVMTWIHDVITPYIRANIPEQEQENTRQRALVAILQKMATEGPREVDGFRMWSLGFARMLIRVYRRERKRDLERYASGVDVDVEPAASTPPPDRLHLAHLLSLLSSFLRRLPQIYRSPLLHRSQGGRDTSFADGRKLKKTTVRWRRYQGRRLLQHMFRSELKIESDQPIWVAAPISTLRS